MGAVSGFGAQGCPLRVALSLMIATAQGGHRSTNSPPGLVTSPLASPVSPAGRLQSETQVFGRLARRPLLALAGPGTSSKPGQVQTLRRTQAQKPQPGQALGSPSGGVEDLCVT